MMNLFLTLNEIDFMETSKLINGYRHILYEGKKIQENELLENSIQLKSELKKRRSIREFSDRPVPKEVIENIIEIASSAPSGANKQPWTFCVVSNPEIKKKIRIAAEEEEFINYNGRMSDRWLKDLEHLATDEHKPFLEKAPYLIIVCKQAYTLDEDQNKMNNYYVNESVGIACGFLISAIHQVGLVTLTHTPSPMNFLAKILNRPENERPFLLLPVGYAEENTFVPDIKKKPLEEVSFFYE